MKFDLPSLFGLVATISVCIALATMHHKIATTLMISATAIVIWSTFLFAVSGAKVRRQLLVFPIVSMAYIFVILFADTDSSGHNPAELAIEKIYKTVSKRPLSESKKLNPFTATKAELAKYRLELREQKPVQNRSWFFVKCHCITSLLLGWFSSKISKILSWISQKRVET